VFAFDTPGVLFHSIPVILSQLLNDSKFNPEFEIQSVRLPPKWYCYC
jgi:hypothetical protein